MRSGFIAKLKKTRLDKGQKRLWNTFVFLVRLLILSIPLYIILAFADLGLVQQWTVDSSVWLFSVLGYSVHSTGFLITVGGGNAFTFFISQDCTAWKSMLFFFALVLAVPGKSWRSRILGLAIGLPIIWIANMFRIFAVVLAGQSYGIDYAMLLHDYLWGLGLAVLVLALWILWIEFFRK